MVCLGPFGIAGDRPVAGDWTGDGRGKIGIYRPAMRQFILDRNNNGILEACTIDICSAAFGAAGDVPLVGDWTGNGLARIGVYRPGTRQFFLDKNSNRILDACGVDSCLGFGLAGDKPVVGAW
jgi:hypothetical protein